MKPITFKSAKGYMSIIMTEEMALFAIMDDEGRDLLRTAIAKMNEFEALYISKHTAPAE
jgi:hypothetical protein